MDYYGTAEQRFYSVTPAAQAHCKSVTASPIKIVSTGAIPVSQMAFPKRPGWGLRHRYP